MKHYFIAYQFTYDYEYELGDKTLLNKGMGTGNTWRSTPDFMYKPEHFETLAKQIKEGLLRDASESNPRMVQSSLQVVLTAVNYLPSEQA